MLAQLNVVDKSFGANQLLDNVELVVERSEKLALIGRNGAGKSTLLRIMTGDDTDYDGELHFSRGSSVVIGRQEHQAYLDQTINQYLLADIPGYSKLRQVIDGFEDSGDSSQSAIQTYTDAVEQFSRRDFFTITDQIAELMSAYQLDFDPEQAKLRELSGGQKRLLELVKLQASAADLALFDEPTNHMDYVSKQYFNRWLADTDQAVVVVSHDRDLLDQVQRIVEVKDKRLHNFRGNYRHYLTASSNSVSAAVNDFQNTQQQIKRLEDDVVRFKRLKERARNPGTIRRFKLQQRQAEDKLSQLSEHDKPTFWIDKSELSDMPDKLKDTYHQHKARNIKIDTGSDQSNNRVLLRVDKAAVGYEQGEPLFEPISFRLAEGEALEIRGRNGAGKSTLANVLRAKFGEADTSAKLLGGKIQIEPRVSLGYYDQELDGRYTDTSLAKALKSEYHRRDQTLTDQQLMRLLSEYLFDPEQDSRQPVGLLSGGQQARLQLMTMLIDQPDVLLLDEPTNHLDLPSIEELEQALRQFSGAIIYITHDSYFRNNLPAEVLEIGNS